MLMEVIVSTLMLMIVLLPSVSLLQASNAVISLNRSKVVAANLASSQLELDRAAADSEGWTGSCNCGTEACECLPFLPPPASPVEVPAGGEPYTVTQDGGWCDEKYEGSSWVWTSYDDGDVPADPDNPPAFAVTVTVSWLGGSESVSAAETLLTPQGVTPPPETGSGPWTTCPSS